MAKRRGNHDGSIHRRKDGSWRAQLTLAGKRLSYSAKTRQAVQGWLKRTIAQVEGGLSYQGASISFLKFLDDWLVSIKTTIRPGTWYQYEMTCRKHIKPSLGLVKLKDISPARIQTLYDEKSKAGMGARSVKVMHVVLHKSLAHAVKLGMIGRNPVEAVIPPRYQPEEMKFLDESQVNQLLLAARGERNETLYYLAVVTGLRQSELLALKWSDLDWKGKTCKVQRQLKRENRKNGYFTVPKTKAGKRTVVLGEYSIARLRIQSERLDLERKIAGDHWQENDLIFPSTIGTPMDQHNLYHVFKRFIGEVGLPGIRFHDLRHTAASIMLNHGIPAIVVARRLGHSKVSITLDTYGHLIPEMQTEAAELMDELVSPIEVELHRTAPKLHQEAEIG